MAALKIFVVTNKVTGKPERLVKATGRAQVVKYLASRIEIEAVGAVELMDLLNGETMKVEDGTLVAGDDTPGEGGAPDSAGTVVDQSAGSTTDGTVSAGTAAGGELAGEAAGATLEPVSSHESSDVADRTS